MRQALGMSATDLGRLMGVSEAGVVSLERNERSRRVQLDTLARAAEAMDCDFVYAVIPRRSLDEAVLSRARELASTRVERVGHSMLLEEQPVTEAATEEALDELARRLVDSPGLWSTDADR